MQLSVMVQNVKLGLLLTSKLVLLFMRGGGEGRSHAVLVCLAASNLPAHPSLPVCLLEYLSVYVDVPAFSVPVCSSVCLSMHLSVCLFACSKCITSAL